MPARAFPRIAEVRAYIRGGGQALSLHSTQSEPAKNSAEAEALLRAVKKTAVLQACSAAPAPLDPGFGRGPSKWLFGPVW